MKFIGLRRPMNREETQTWLEKNIELQKNTITRFAVSLKESDELIGVSGIQQQDNNWDFGYYFRRKYWGKGYAFESCKESLIYIERNLDIQDYQIFIAQENVASISLITRLGFSPGELIVKDGETGNYYKPCASKKSHPVSDTG